MERKVDSRKWWWEWMGEKRRGTGPDGDYVVAARPIDLDRVC